MAPIKLEEHIREKLQERELHPTPQAWEKLAEQLEPSEEKKNNGYFWWAIAAGLAAMLLVGSLLFDGGIDGDEEGSQIVNESPVPVVNEPENNTELASETPQVPEELDSETNIPEEEILLTEDVAMETNGTSEAKKIRKEQPVEKVEDKMIAKVTGEIPNEDLKKETSNASFFDEKVNEVALAVQKLQNDKGEVSPEEIDDLLQKAQRDIRNRRILDQQTNKIDAAALLEDVEWELERTFRDKVFDALGDGFKKVRTAVAERNN